MSLNSLFKKCFLVSACLSFAFSPIYSDDSRSELLNTSIAHANFFDDFSISDEVKLGKEFEILVKSQLPIIEDPEIKLYIVGLMDKIMAHVPPQPFKFEANVVYNPALNAFASPGGKIFIFSGLLTDLENEDQLAGIMAHEIAHATQRHIADNIDRSKYINIASLAGMLAGALSGGEGAEAAVGASAALGQSARLNYSRKDENDADRFGLQYMIDAGFNPMGMAESFEILQQNSFGLGSNFPSYLSTHPGLSSRISTVKSHIQSLPKAISTRQSKNPQFTRAKALSMAYFADHRHATTYFANPKSALDYMGQGILASKKNQLQNARTAFDKALQLAPNDSLILREAGKFYFENGDFSKAHLYLKKSLRNNSKEYMAMFFYARLLDAEKRYIEAQAQYEKILEYAPEDSEVYEFYGLSLGKNKQEFEGYLALAKAALYANSERRAKKWLGQAEKLANDDNKKKQLEETKKILAERKKYWK